MQLKCAENVKTTMRDDDDDCAQELNIKFPYCTIWWKRYSRHEPTTMTTRQGMLLNEHTHWMCCNSSSSSLSLSVASQISIRINLTRHYRPESRKINFLTLYSALRLINVLSAMFLSPHATCVWLSSFFFQSSTSVISEFFLAPLFGNKLKSLHAKQCDFREVIVTPERW